MRRDPLSAADPVVNHIPRSVPLFEKRISKESTTSTLSTSQVASDNGLPANYEWLIYSPLAFILYSFMEIECISLREQLNALVVIYKKSGEVSSPTDGQKNVNVPALPRDSPSPPFPAGTTLLTEYIRK